MARLLIVLIAVLTVLVLIDARKGGRKGKKAARKCAKNIKKFETCLKKGYKSKDGCISGEGALKKKDLRRCNKVAKRVKKCDYICKKPEPYDLRCKRAEINYWGADIRSFKAASFHDCAMACAKEPSCKSITTRNSDNYCWLKNKNSGYGGPDEKVGYTSMNMMCDTSTVDDSCKRDNFDFWGADLKKFKSQSFEECAKLCRDTDGCQSITLRKSDNYCWLKKKRGGYSGPSPNNALISMNIVCASGFDASDKKCAMDGYDFGGADLKSFRSNGYEDCRTSCFDAADCVSFTLRKSDNHCWMKTMEGGQNGPKAVSGLISANMKC